MPLMRISIHSLGLLLLLTACSPDPPPAKTDDAALLAEVLESFWSYVFENDTYLMVRYGKEVKIPDLTLAKARERSDVARRHLERLTGVRPDELSHEDWVTYQVFKWDLGIEAERAQHYWAHLHITPRMLRVTYVPDYYQRFGLASSEDLEAYLRLLRQLPDFFKQMLEKLYGQVERGILVPKSAIDLWMPTWRRLALQGAQSPFYVSATRLTALAETHGEEVAAFEAEAEKILTEEVEPLTKSLIDYLTGEYYEAAPETVGYGQYPGGPDYYRFMARYFTTLDTSPEEIHQLGLRRVAEVEAEMEQVRDSVGFSGTREQFHDFLRNDARFIAASPDDLARRLQSFVDKIEPRLDAYFTRRPHAPYRLERLPEAYESGMTFGYYDPPSETESTGRYLYNASQLDQRSLFSAEALIYHELMPGHHMQVSLQIESTGRHAFLQNNFYSAHAEGWGDYASRLAREMGMYEDPHSYYGLLALELRGSVRLVTDTGMNALGWTRERATTYLNEHALDSGTQIATEVLRYSVDLPGQALAYRIGADTMLDLRRRAEEALGERFDIRRFHDAILDYSPMPLKVLEQHVEWFIEQEGG